MVTVTYLEPGDSLNMLDPETTRTARHTMLKQQLESRGIQNLNVLKAMAEIPREQFVPANLISQAYQDGPLGIGHGQTISQPYMVAVMAEALDLKGDEIVLEVGAGSGYGAAVLSRLAKQVVAIERIPELLDQAQTRWNMLNLNNIIGVLADGSLGSPLHAPFDAISVTAAAPNIPPSLLAQLRPKTGRMTLPTGDRFMQYLCLVAQNSTENFTLEKQFPCTFVPLLGKEGW